MGGDEDDSVRAAMLWTYLSGQHKKGDEEDEEGDRAHCLQVFENTGPRAERGGRGTVPREREIGEWGREESMWVEDSIEDHRKEKRKIN